MNKKPNLKRISFIFALDLLIIEFLRVFTYGKTKLLRSKRGNKKTRNNELWN